MSYHVRTDNFEGPFDLLLYLVARQRVDIGSVAIAEIADQYLEEVARLKDLDLDVASDFMLVASTLLELKAASLLPAPPDKTDEDIAALTADEAREVLVERLQEYKQFKNAAIMLGERAEEQSRMHPRTAGPDQRFLSLVPDFLRGVTPDGLAFLAAGAFGKHDVALLESDHIAAKPIPVEVHMHALHRRIRTEKHLRFSQLVDASAGAPMVVVTFLAVLELYKRNMVRVRQVVMFGDIDIDFIEGSGELDLAVDGAPTSVGEE